MKVSLVCIAKNEDHYIDEWIKYHLKLGFDDIFVYTNDWDFNYSHPNVHITEFNGSQAQIRAYTHCYDKISSSYNWIAFFDVDEFLVLKKHENIKDFLKDYTEYASVSINWVLFGDNNITFVNNEYSVIKRFTKRQILTNNHVKSIYNTLYPHKVSIHNSNIPSVDPNFNSFSGPFNNIGGDEIAQLNHYFCKTKEEFKNKVERGRADTGEIRDYSVFDICNLNEIEDLHAYKFMYGN
jgi:hypothetical protein